MKANINFQSSTQNKSTRTKRWTIYIYFEVDYFGKEYQAPRTSCGLRMYVPLDRKARHFVYCCGHCRRYGADSSIPRAETARDTVFGIVIGIRMTRAIYPIPIPAFRVPCVRRGILTRLCSSARRQGITASCIFYRVSIIPNAWIFGINESCEYVHSFAVL